MSSLITLCSSRDVGAAAAVEDLIALCLCFLHEQVSTLPGFTSSFIQDEVLTEDVSLYSQGISRSVFSIPLLISQRKNEASSFDELVRYFFLQLISSLELCCACAFWHSEGMNFFLCLHTGVFLISVRITTINSLYDGCPLL